MILSSDPHFDCHRMPDKVVIEKNGISDFFISLVAFVGLLLFYAAYKISTWW